MEELRKQINISTPKNPNTFVIVDDEDYEYLNQWKWHLSSNGYAVRRPYIKGSEKTGQKHTVVWMHRVINNTPAGRDTDHINRDRLDNRRSNLRTATFSQNSMNKGLSKSNTSGIKGISW